MISASEWRAYNEGVRAVSQGAEDEVVRRLLAWRELNPAATAAECREATKLVFGEVVQSYDSVASSFAAEWYDYRAEQAGARLRQAVTSTVYSPKTADEVARYRAKKLAKGDFEGFARACGEYAANDALRSLNATIMANAKRDRREGVRFARVPTGWETCTFCLMLASRGAVYHTRQTAGEFKHFHRRCDCKVVPGFEDDPMAELVEGYRPRELYDRWKAFDQIDSWKWLSVADRNEIKSRVLIADASLFKARKLGMVGYAKPRSLLEEHERAGIDYLSFNGFDVEVIMEDPKAPANLDISMDGDLWEMKNLTNSGSLVSNQVKRARVKWYKLKMHSPMTCVFTNEGNESSFGETCAALDARRRAGEVFLAIASNGITRVLKDK